MHISFILSSTNLRKFVIVASVFVLVVAMIPSSRLTAASSHSAGYHHGCDDAKISNVDDRYISQPGKGPSFHTQEFMNRYNAGLRACSDKPSPMDSSTLFTQGYAKGVLDAKSKTFPTSNTMSPDDVDCDSDIDPQASNADYCSAYQHGFADTINNALPTTRELSAAKSLPPVTSTKLAPVVPPPPPPKVCPDGSALGASGNCPPATQAPTDQGTTVPTTNDNTNTKHHKGTDLGQLGGSLLNSDNNPAPPPPNGGDNTNNNNDNNNKPSKDHKGGDASTQPASTDQGTQ
jgi:hypothetical protein